MPRRDLDPLLRPGSVAVVGASRTPGKVGHEVVSNLQRGGFAGALYPVNPEAEEILGLACYPEVAALPPKVDLCVVAVPAGQVRATVAAAVAAGVGSVAVLSAGFKEVGSAALEHEVANLCRAHRVPLLGPNCLGVVNTWHRMNATFAPAWPPAGGISLISQSGALAASVLDRAAAEELGLATVVSFGNKADVDEIDLLTALARDEDTRVIAGFLENIDDGDAFLQAAEEAAAAKPVVLMKVGVSGPGARAASTHTGSLVGTDIAYGAAFRRAGVVRAESFEALLDAARAFAGQPLPASRRAVILTNAGGAGILAADAAEEHGLELPRPSAAVRGALAALPPEASVANPVDVGGDADPQRFLTAFEALQACPDSDAVVLLAAPGQQTEPTRLAEGLVSAWKGEKPLLTAFLGGAAVAEARRVLGAAGIPDYPSPERAVAALAALSTYAAWRRRPPRVVTRFPVNRRRVDRILRRHERLELTRIGEVEAKEILRAYDFRILDGGLAESAEEAVEIAERIGYPVVLKIVSPDVVHKSDFGGVRLRLADPEQVREAWDLTRLRAERRRPPVRLRGCYVEKMGRRGREVVLGMTRDPRFGPLLMFGLGGIFVEVMKDVTFHLAPITAEEAREMLRGTRSFALLEGARGHAPVDLAALAGGLQRISQLATDYPQIVELDLNPFVVGAVGEESWVADARMTLAPPGARTRR